MSTKSQGVKRLDSIQIPRIRGSSDKLQVIARLIISLVKVSDAAFFQSKHFGSRADDFLIMSAAYVGEADGRPMTAAKVADYAGLPRATVVRRAAALKRQGVLSIDGRGKMSVVHRSPEVSGLTVEIIQGVVTAAAAELSRMDT